MNKTLKNKGTLRTCKNGHQYYKSSECPVCPMCEQEHKPNDGFLSVLSAPARRALQNAGIKTVIQLSKKTKKEIARTDAATEIYRAE